METSRLSSAPVSSPRAGILAQARAWLMLISRPALFFLVQAAVALVLALTGTASAWAESARWWLFFVIVANVISVYLLVRLYRQEGTRYLDAIRFSRTTWKPDLLWYLGLSIVMIPIAAAPMNLLGPALFGDRMVPVHLMFRPLPTWALILGLLFPLTIGFAELPTYFGYCMPRLAVALKNGWLAWLIASFFLAAQHMFLPFLLDGRFLLWRLLMYLPFALFTGLCLKLRPTLMPYFMIGHALIDITTLSVYLTI